MYDLETVQEVVRQHLVHAVHSMQEEAHERDVDVLVELFHVGREAALYFNYLSMFLRAGIVVMEHSLLMHSSCLLGRNPPSRRFTLTVSVQSGGKWYCWPISTNSSGVASMVCQPGSRNFFT